MRPLLQGDIIGLRGSASVLDGSHRATRGPQSQRFNSSDPRGPDCRRSDRRILSKTKSVLTEEALVTTLMKGAAGNIADATKAAKALKMSNLPP
jgi:hypothetical protein